MTQWIEITRVRQNGEPITRSIKIEGMDEEIWFTTKAYAEVKDNVADLLASQNDFINKISAPSTPGTYYEEANANQAITITLPDGAFDKLSAESIDIDSGIDLTTMEAADPFEPASLKTSSVDTDELSSTSVDTERVTSAVINSNRVVDSTGRYHGELTGSNDAQVVIDAIADRPSGADIHIPNPGFDLEWEQQVDLPGDENRFSIITSGVPNISVPSSFGDSYAINKPASPTRSYSNYFGPMQIYDEGRSLDAALYLDDIGHCIVDRLYTERTPGIKMFGTNNTSSNNLIFQPFIKTAGGIGIELGDEAQGNSIYSPLYDNTGGYTTRAFVDKGSFNSWYNTRTEACLIPHTCDKARNYLIIEGNWDRKDDYEHTVEEKNGAFGRLWIQNRVWDFQKLKLSGPHTDVIFGGNDGVGNGCVDYLDRLKETTFVDSLSSLGLSDDSSGGSVTLDKTWERIGLEYATGATAGNTAATTQGGVVFDVESLAPKISLPMHPAQTSNVLVKAEVKADDSNRFGFVYDPTNSEGNHSTSNWYFEMESGGTLQDGSPVDTGIAPSSGGVQIIHFQYNQGVMGDRAFSGYINGTEVAEVVNSGSDLGDAELSISVETTDSTNKTWFIRTSRGVRALTA